MQIYKHRQTGRLTLIALGCGALLTAALAVAVAPGPATAVVCIVLVTVLLALLMFSSLTVEVTSDRVTAWFGPGVFRKTFRPGTDELQQLLAAIQQALLNSNR